MLFGRIAVHLKMITAQDLAIVTSAQQRAPVWRPLGQMLVDEGLINEEQVQQVLAFQRARAGGAAPQPKPPTPPPTSPPSPSPSRSTASDAIRDFARELDDPPPKKSAPAFASPPPAFAQPMASSFAPAPPGARPTGGEFRAPPHSDPFQMPKTDPSRAAARSTPSTPPTAPVAASMPRTSSAITILPVAASAPLPSTPPGFQPAVAVLDREGRPTARNTDVSPLHRVLAEAVRLGASDIHMHSAARLRFRIAGSMREMGDELLSPWRVGETVLAALSDDEYSLFCVDGEIDFPYTAPGIGRFRCNIYKQQHGIDAVFRSLPPHPPSLEELGLPAEFGKLANHHQGIVLFTGPSGCGKSATMSAVLNLVNQSRPDHIVTIEDPIEVLHESAQSIVNQRQAKTHTASFGRALRAALREDPDVICIGEMRDYETISLAVSAAETGHLVMGTLHTSSAIRTIGRVLGVFPPQQQDQVRSMVAESLRAVISQRLVARADGKGRVPALEILYVNQAVANLIRENRTMMIKSVLQTGQATGMCSLDNSLEALVKDGTITRQEAARHADEPKKFQ